MATVQSESDIRTGAKSVRGLESGAYFFFDPEKAKDDYAAKGVGDKDATAVAESVDAEAAGDPERLRDVLAANNRFKSTYSGKWFSVNRDGNQRTWITS